MMRIWLSLFFLSACLLAALGYFGGGLSGFGPGDWFGLLATDAASPRATPAARAPADKRQPSTAAEQELASRTPATEPATPETTPPWGVQLAADFDREKALAQFTRAREQFAEVLGVHEPTIVSETNLSLGRKARFVVQVGAQSREAARELCQRLRDNGGACIVIKN